VISKVASPADILNSRLFRFSFPIFSVLFALVLQLIFRDEIGQKTFLLLYPALFFGSVYCGLFPNIIATILASLSAWYLFVPKLYTWELKSSADVFGLVVFSTTGLLFGVFSEKLRKTRLAEREITRNLKLAKEAAEAANEAKSNFLANMSHEIRTPLGAVMGFSELVVDPQLETTDKTSYVSAIRRNGELLSNIINDILDLSKVEAGKMEVQACETSLPQLLTDTLTVMKFLAEEKGIRLEVHRDKNLPDIISTDQIRFKQILINIIGNAIKFTSKGSVFVEIAMKEMRDQTQIVVTVRDTGKGIAPEETGKLFSFFSQGDVTTTRKYGGTGLGLVLSKKLAGLLGGDIALLETNLGKGSTFEITIDAGRVHYAKFPNSQMTLVGAKNTTLENLRVLLAEDSPDNQILVTRLLEKAGASVDTVSNGEDAVSLAEKGQYDVLLMDLQMPIMDGYEATSKLRKNGYKGKILALTAHAMLEERNRCLRSGFDDHLTKPISSTILLEKVANYSR
jgi:signal transduction histidine kinase/CheY-like chemotaxis protein